MSSKSLLYHYTTTADANKIRNDGFIRPQGGITLSTLKPGSHPRDYILRTLDTSEIKVSANNVMDKPPGGKPRNSRWLYYYTNQENATRIKQMGFITCLSVIYLVSMSPESYYRNEILYAIYGGKYDAILNAKFSDWCVKIDRTKLDVNKLKQNGKVYEYSETIIINPANVMDKPQCNRPGQGSNNAKGGTDEYFYHYTNTAGAQLIKAAGYLKMSGASGKFGVGVYMTSLRPTDFFRDDILKNNYGGINSAFKGRADWVVRVKKSNLVQGKLKTVGSSVTRDGSRQIFVYEDEIAVQRSDVFDKPTCYRA